MRARRRFGFRRCGLHQRMKPCKEAFWNRLVLLSRDFITSNFLLFFTAYRLLKLMCERGKSCQVRDSRYGKGLW